MNTQPTATNFDIKAMSEEMNISIGLLKKILGVPFEVECTATTIKKAKHEHGKVRTVISHNSEEIWVIRERLRELSLEAVKFAKTLKRIHNLFYEEDILIILDPEGKKILFDKWLSFLPTMEKIYKELEKMENEDPDWPINEYAEKIFHKKLDKLSLKAAKHARTLKDLKYVYKFAAYCKEGKSFEFILKKMASFYPQK